MEISGGAAGAAGAAPAAGAGEAAASNEQKPAEGGKATDAAKIDQILQNQEQLISILTGALGSTPSAAPAGAVGAMPEAMGQGVPGMAEMPPPELPAAPAPTPAPAAPPMTVAASDRNALVPKQADERVSSINRVMNNLLNNNNGGGQKGKR
jgi:hypothetical protein